MFYVFVFLLGVCASLYYIKGLLDFENSFNVLLVSGSHLPSCDPGLASHFLNHV